MAYSNLDKAWADTFWKRVKKYVQEHGGGSPSDLGDLAYKDSASGPFTPSGNVSAPTITVSPSTTSVNTMESAGSLPSLVFTVTGTDLEITWSAGTLPTQGSKTVMTGASASSSKPSFTGTTGTVTVS